jgi:hypothetical protein
LASALHLPPATSSSPPTTTTTDNNDSRRRQQQPTTAGNSNSAIVSPREEPLEAEIRIRRIDPISRSDQIGGREIDLGF